MDSTLVGEFNISGIGGKVKLGLIQTQVSDDLQENTVNTIRKIEEAVMRGANIVCLQELFRTKYFPQEDDKDYSYLAETVPGQSSSVFSDLAKKHKIVIIVPVFEKTSSGKYFNTAVVIDADGEIKGTYRKVHVPNDPCFYEQHYFEPGNLGFQVFKTGFAKVGVLICYDQWFPEPARILALKGAEIIFYPTAIGWIKNYDSPDGDWHEAWKTVQRAHAIENGVHVAAVNRVGEEGELKFWGGSFVSDSFGQMLKEASSESEETLIVEVDLEKNKRIQEGWGFLENRKPDTYRALIE